MYIRTIMSNLQVTMGFVSIVHLNNQLSKIKLDRATKKKSPASVLGLD